MPILNGKQYDILSKQLSKKELDLLLNKLSKPKFIQLDKNNNDSKRQKTN